MSALRDAIKIRKQYESRFAQEVVLTNGEIVARDGSTRVPGVPNHYWVIPLGEGEPVAVYNRNVKATRPGLAVQIGYAPNSTVLEILRTVIDANSQAEDTGGNNMEPHSASHLVDGDDPLFIETRAITALLTYPIGESGLSVHVSNCTYVAADSSFAVFGGSLYFDLSSYQPGSGSLLALVYLDKNTNELSVATGSTIPQDSPAFIPPAPDLPDGGIPSAFVRLGASSTAIVWDDIIEARDFLGTGGGGSVYPGPGEVKIGTTLYATLEDAFTAMASGDIIRLGPGEYLVEATVPDGIGRIIGSGRGVTVIGNSGTDTLTFAGTGSISDCSVYSDAGDALVMTSTVEARNVEFSSGDVNVSAGNLAAYDCYIDSLAQSGGTVTVFGGEINDLNVSAGTLYLRGPQIAGTITGAPDNSSWYFDLNGLKVEVGQGVAGHRMQGQADGTIYTVKDNLTATTDPTVDDDDTEGYEVGSLWFNTTARTIFRCWDATTGAAVWTAVGSNNGSVDNGVCEGRLTLTSGTPVTTSDVTGATTLYFTPFWGNRISLYDGTSDWSLYLFSELSLSLSGWTANKNNDIFIYDNSGTLTLERAEWTNNSTRATALTTQDGVLVKSGAATRRYLGTIRTTGTTGQCEDSISKRFVWNMYSRQFRPCRSYNSNTSWNLVGATSIREFNGGTGQTRAEIVVGQAAFIYALMNFYVSSAAGGCDGYIGIDSTAAGTTPGQSEFGGGAPANPSMRIGPGQAQKVLSEGYHYVTQLESSNNNATVYPGGGAYSQAIVWTES